MKTFLRAMSAFLLCAMLTTLTLWRNDAFPDLSGITDWVADTQSKLNSLVQIPGFGDAASGARPTDSNADFPTYDLSAELDPELEKQLCDAMLAGETSVDISTYGMDKEAVTQVINAIRFSHPELFFMGKQFNVVHTGGVVTQINLNYEITDRETVASMAAEYEAWVSEIATGISEDASDFDKLLYLHDHFIKNYTYDNTLTIRDAYTFFQKKTGVCQAYMLALIAVTDVWGIECIPVTSARMNHAWNMVKLEGQWYHMDVTWDDGASLPTQTSYDYFLQSDAGIIDIDKDLIRDGVELPNWHCDWSATKKATDTKYDGAAWRNSRTPMIKGEGTYYCVASETSEQNADIRGAVYSGTDPAAMTKLFDIEGKWYANETEFYSDCYAGLAFWNGKLYFNTQNCIKVYHFDRQTVQSLGIVVGPGSSIFGICGTQEGKLVYVVAADPMATEYHTDYYRLSA